MRVSIWKQYEPRRRWLRVGVVEIDAAGHLPWKYPVSYGERNLPRRWPRFVFHTMEVLQPSLFSGKGAAR